MFKFNLLLISIISLTGCSSDLSVVDRTPTPLQSTCEPNICFKIKAEVNADGFTDLQLATQVDGLALPPVAINMVKTSTSLWEGDFNSDKANTGIPLRACGFQVTHNVTATTMSVNSISTSAIRQISGNLTYQGLYLNVPASTVLGPYNPFATSATSNVQMAVRPAISNFTGFPVVITSVQTTCVGGDCFTGPNAILEPVGINNPAIPSMPVTILGCNNYSNPNEMFYSGLNFKCKDGSDGKTGLLRITIEGGGSISMPWTCNTSLTSG